MNHHDSRTSRANRGDSPAATLCLAVTAALAARRRDGTSFLLKNIYLLLALHATHYTQIGRRQQCPTRIAVGLRRRRATPISTTIPRSSPCEKCMSTKHARLLILGSGPAGYS